MADSSDIFHQIQNSLHEGAINEAISLVEDSDVDIDYRDVTHDLQTILMKICYIELCVDELQSVLEAMFNKRPDVNIQDSWGRTFLMHACIANKPCIIEALLDYDITDVTIIDFDGNSALFYAVQSCDVYTLEDILNHKHGPKLLNIYNSKGQSPYSIAEKRGDKQVLRLFDSHVNKSVGLQDKRTRKHKHRDVIKLPPPVYAPQTPRDAYVTPRVNTARNSGEQSKISCELNLKGGNRMKQHVDSDLELSLNKRNSDIAANESVAKCDSAPVTRSHPIWPGREQCMTSLSLSSPRLTRRHHKQDSLYSEPMPLNKHLPHMKNLKDSQTSLSGTDDEPEVQYNRHRRPSISLPDLRDMSARLICSGNSSPNTDSELSNDPDCNDEDVFSQSYSNHLPLKSSRRPKHKVPQRQLTLPEIHAGFTSMTSCPKNSKGISPLARHRKYSNSDDRLQKTLLMQQPT